MKNNKKEVWPPRITEKKGEPSGWADLVKEQSEQRASKKGKGEASNFEAGAETDDMFPPSEEAGRENDKHEKPSIFRLEDLRHKK